MISKISKMSLYSSSRIPSPFSSYITKMNRKYSKNPTYKYRSKYLDLWRPAQGWLTSYKCASCCQVMSRKIPSKCPQRITNCGHITCANCITKSYFIELNPLCPVKDCTKCVNLKQKNIICDLEDNVEVNLEDFIWDNPHSCGDWICPGDCGVLFCGCIDVCRGRCGFRDDI